MLSSRFKSLQDHLHKAPHPQLRITRVEDLDRPLAQRRSHSVSLCSVVPPSCSCLAIHYRRSADDQNPWPGENRNPISSVPQVELFSRGNIQINNSYHSYCPAAAVHDTTQVIRWYPYICFSIKNATLTRRRLRHKTPRGARYSTRERDWVEDRQEGAEMRLGETRRDMPQD